MPKYIPSQDDLYNTNPCPICGRDIIFDNSETCSENCQYFLEDYRKDMEWFLLIGLEKDDLALCNKPLNSDGEKTAAG